MSSRLAVPGGRRTLGTLSANVGSGTCATTRVPSRLLLHQVPGDGDEVTTQGRFSVATVVHQEFYVDVGWQFIEEMLIAQFYETADEAHAEVLAEPVASCSALCLGGPGRSCEVVGNHYHVRATAQARDTVTK